MCGRRPEIHGRRLEARDGWHAIEEAFNLPAAEIAIEGFSADAFGGVLAGEPVGFDLDEHEAREISGAPTVDWKRRRPMPRFRASGATAIYSSRQASSQAKQQTIEKPRTRFASVATVKR